MGNLRWMVVGVLLCGGARATDEDACAVFDREAAKQADALSKTTDAQQRALLDGAVQAYRNQAVACREQENVRKAALVAAEKQAAEQEARDRPALERLRKDPSALQQAFSAPLCSLEEKRARLKKAIVRAKREARRSGADTGDEKQLRLQLTLLDVEAQRWTRALEGAKLAPLPCNEQLRTLAACIDHAGINGEDCPADQRLLAKLARDEKLRTR